MAFPITRAREKLGTTGQVGVRSNVDVRTAAGAIGRAAEGFGQAVSDIGLKWDLKEANTQFSEYQRKVREDNILRDQEVRQEVDPEKHDAIFKAHAETQAGFMPRNKRAARAAQIWDNRIAPQNFQALVDGKRIRIEDNWREELFNKQQEVQRTGSMGDFEQFLARGIVIDLEDPTEIGAPLSKKEAGRILSDTRKMAVMGNITNVYRGGNHAAARELLEESDLTIREKEQMDDEIDRDERAALTARSASIDKATSDTLREFFNGDLTVTELNERHAEGNIRDSEFKFMREGLNTTAPERSNPLAAARVRRAKTDLDMGLITTSQAEFIALENYEQLSAADREGVFADFADVEAKVIATAKSNAYSEGKSMMSVEFLGIEDEEGFLKLIGMPGLSDDEKKRINARWIAETDNRDLYEKAVDERFKELRKEGVTDPAKFRAESLGIMLEYRRRRELNLAELQAVVQKEQRQIISGATKSIGEMTADEKRVELEKVRALRKLVQ